ncbi:MAG: polysaccharide biosynthesis C-terminal domain-containing protein, partial [Chlamydiales bacterium]
FLAHYTLESFEGCVNAVYLCSLFQLTCIRITSMAQIFVGFHKGANHQNLIGPCIWQMIWFSLFSMLITLPCGMVVGPFFLGGTAIEKPAMTYFQTLMSVNFLFPLSAALSSFYIAEGKTKPLILATLATQLVNILFDYLLIFGIPNFLPPQGIFGAALATGIAQGSFCLILFCLFLQKQYRERYATDKFALRWKAFWNYVQVGIPRAIARAVLLVAWAGIVRIMTLKGAITSSSCRSEAPSSFYFLLLTKEWDKRS